MNTNKSCLHDFLPPRFIKDSSNAIPVPLQTSEMNPFFGANIPIFKKDDGLLKENNYRPVTVLPCLNNIFEK